MMTEEERQSRREAYERILHFGLIAIRNVASSNGRADICEIEADHLHNIPSLLAETNEQRHVYYAVQERGLYLERIQAAAGDSYVSSTVKLYEKYWKTILKIAIQSQEEINKELEQEVGQVSSESALPDELST